MDPPGRENGFARPRRGNFLLRETRTLQSGQQKLLVNPAVPFPKTEVPGQGKSTIPMVSALLGAPKGHWGFPALCQSGKIQNSGGSQAKPGRTLRQGPIFEGVPKRVPGDNLLHFEGNSDFLELEPPRRVPP